MRLDFKASIAIAGTAIAASIANAGDTPVTFGGFFSNGYLQSSNYNYLGDTEDGTFDFVEMGVNANWSPIERTTITGQLFAYELGPYGNYDPIIDYLFVDYSVSQQFGVRLGRVKKPFGIYNEIQGVDVARTSILLPWGMYDPRYRDFMASVDGISTYGSLNIGDRQSLEYNFYYGAVDISPEGGVGAFAESEIAAVLPGAKLTHLESDINYGTQLWYNTPISGLRFGYGYSYYADINLKAEGTLPGIFPPIPPVAGAPFVYEVDVDEIFSKFSVEYYYDLWTFTGELEKTTSNTIKKQTFGPIALPAEKGIDKREAWYISVSRRFLNKYEGAVTYTSQIGDLEFKELSTGYVKDWQFSLRYDATMNWTLKAEFHKINGTHRIFNQLGQNPVIDDPNWSLWALKSSFMF